ncbi:hypothetical protein [Maridesulfovibrio zosterae]|uniref:hypothetical protein n=1 Tax=Maridesulfovibrio zosterae TaxID=82171 RepID=UPI0004838A66|nr:hypothetical protein [Maridesulfovibrio zosterae]
MKIKIKKAKYVFHLSLLLISLLAIAGLGFASDNTGQRLTELKSQEKYDFQEPAKFQNTNEYKRLNAPKLARIPAKEDINPHKASEVPPSKELMKIINEIKNQSTPSLHKKEKSLSDKRNKVSKSSLEIIKAKENTIRADEILPSPALKAVLEAFKDGNIAYIHRDFLYDDENDQYYYHQPYTEVNLQSVYDMTVLTSGKDIFLSLGYTPLKASKSTEENKSQRIKDLQQTIAAFAMKDSQKAAAISPDEKEIDRIRSAAKIKPQPRKLFVKQVLDFFGIRKRDSSTQDYEEMAKTFRLYKQWLDRWDRMDKYVKRKRAQKLQLNQYRNHKYVRTIRTAPILKDLAPTKQIQINPYAYDKVYMKP